MTIYPPPDHPKGVALETWTISLRPPAYPGWVVLQRHDGGEAAPWLTLCESIEQARRLIPAGLCPCQRQPGDDPWIVETWM